MTAEDFQAAIEKFHGRLVVYLETMGRDKDDADDIVQTALIELSRKHESFVGNTVTTQAMFEEKPL